jgi:predicted CXXCH cytochrome family protein
MTDAAAPLSSHYVGSAVCASCHGAEVAAWRSSHHAQSMQTAGPQTVLGNFENQSIAGPSGPIRFSQHDGKYFANTIGLRGVAEDFQVLYTFGVHPLQQYLVALPGGRLQVLAAAWDSRPRNQNGQRWFSLYPHEHLAAGTPLHWTGRDQNWNFMCADCHSTGLRRNYSPDSNTYQTVWSEIDVACEACHGPGSRHVNLAGRSASRQSSSARPESRDTGLVVNLHASRTVQWGFWSADQKIASAHGSLAEAAKQSESCFGCHARRQAITDAPAAGHALLDDYLPQLLESGVYRADGQIDAEDFEYGSFIQSKMHSKGVTCTNCHDPHSLKLRETGNALCTQCHRADYFDQPGHHHHTQGSAGAQCVNCHMPARTYMQIHSRRDHSLRVPRPDLSAALGIPNSCNDCHRDQKAAWAAAAISRWTGHPADTAGHFANALDTAWAGGNAVDSLLAIARSPAGEQTASVASGMVRASALASLPSQTAPLPEAAHDVLTAAASDTDPVVRLGVARALAGLPAVDAARIGSRLLSDPRRAVRIEAGRALIGPASDQQIPADQMTAAQQVQLQSAVAELVAAERATAERPESHVNLAQIYSRSGRADEADKQLQTALRLDPHFLPALVNLADLERSRGHDTAAERWLLQAIAVAPRAAEPVHALGLLKVRQGQRAEALPLLGKASRLDPATTRYTYIYAIALAESGQRASAVSVVAAALKRSPKDASLLELQQQLTQSR